MYSPDCSTGELQPHTSEIITEIKENLLPTGPVLKIFIMLLLLLRYLLTFWKGSSLSVYIWLLQITEFLQLEATASKKNWNTRSRSIQIEPKKSLLQKTGPTMFELVRWIQNNDVFKKSLIRETTDLVESRLHPRERIAFSEDKVAYFWSLDLYHEPMDNSNFRFFPMEP